MKEKVGICIIGMNGAVSSTAIVGLELLKKGMIEKNNLISEGFINKTNRTIVPESKSGDVVSIAESLDLCKLDDFVIQGWDVNQESVYESAINNGIIKRDLIDKVKDETIAMKPWKAFTVIRGVGAKEINVINESNFMEASDKIIENINHFREVNNLKNVMLVNLHPTEKWLNLGDIHSNLNLFEDALKNNHELINDSMVYAYSALKAGAGFIEFTPTISIQIPAISNLANEEKIPICGKDGKTGQTFLKVALAHAFRARQLRIEGWFSTNLLGNRDGETLANPENLDTKVKSKSEALSKIMGYDIDSHIVNINYYPPRGDNKEAWDNIDITGFCGENMQIKINFLCKDSILAAPMVIDLVRFMDYAMKNNEFGFQPWLSMFFKHPLHDEIDYSGLSFFEQERLLTDIILNGAN